jgi:asparagine synthetase A|tara:strand:+ start:439 stop:639 length:201 start_codon:yes stop_codon:yes gene_type:complete
MGKGQYHTLSLCQFNIMKREMLNEILSGLRVDKKYQNKVDCFLCEKIDWRKFILETKRKLSEKSQL